MTLTFIFEKLKKSNDNHLSMKLFAFMTLAACSVAAYPKPMDINQVLRKQIHKLAHEYDSQKHNKHHHLKNKAAPDAIKKDLMKEFRKTALETEFRLQKRAKAMQANSKRRRKNGR